jgi:glycosyltransferase involved in cell wall biosynthesis
MKMLIKMSIAKSLIYYLNNDFFRGLAMKKKIIIQYPFIAKYRVPIFKLLSQSDKYFFEFWADKQSNDKFLLTDDSSLNIKLIPTAIFTIPIIKKNIEWQPKAILKTTFTKMDLYIVLGNPYSLSTWICVLIAKAKRVPILMWSHGYLKHETGVKNTIRKFFYNISDGHLLYGNRAKSIMMKKKFDSKSLHVIYNSLEYGKQSYYRDLLNYDDRVSTRAEFGISEGSIVLIAIGRLMNKLKLDQAIKGVRIANNKKDVFLIIVGDGPDRENLQNLSKNIGISKKIFFYGACHDEKKLSALYNASDYSVVMGKVGLAAMHSLAYGIPMITNNNIGNHYPEIEAIKDNLTGYFYIENDLDDFVSKINPVKYRSTIYKKCIAEIQKNYTPEMQFNRIERAISCYL